MIAEPSRVLSLPRDADGEPIPWSVATLTDGTRDRALTDPARYIAAFRERKCFTCGMTRGRYTAYVGDPVTIRGGLTKIPGSHYDCAQWAASSPPPPGTRRRDAPPRTEQQRTDGTVTLAHEIGVQVVWVTRADVVTTVRQAARLGAILGRAERLLWFVNGQYTTPDDVPEMHARLLPPLDAAAKASEDPDGLRLEILAQVEAMAGLLRQHEYLETPSNR